MLSAPNRFELQETVRKRGGGGRLSPVGDGRNGMARRAEEVKRRDIHGVKKKKTAEDCKRGRKVKSCRRWKEWQGEQKKEGTFMG